jgi:acetyl-CoA carboxylase biotin carboxyl carrier protein
MTSPELQVIIERDGVNEGAFNGCSPAVGLYSLPPESGSVLRGGDCAGRLTILNQSYDLVLPSDAGGRVSELGIDAKMAPVEYGKVLFRLTPIGTEQQLTGIHTGAASASEPGAEGASPVLSPTDGIFYGRADPDAEPYVKAGDRVTAGQTLGLVEVMKCFNPIQYGGPGLPLDAEIVKVCADDGAEIKSEQVLFLVR